MGVTRKFLVGVAAACTAVIIGSAWWVSSTGAEARARVHAAEIRELRSWVEREFAEVRLELQKLEKQREQ